MCGVARNMTAITEKGDLYPCHRYVGEEKYKIGTLQDGIDESRVRRYYGEILEGYDNHCAGCWARGVCGGQCPWYLSRPDGKVGLPDKASCDSIRTGMERALWMYTKAIQAAPGENVLTTEGVKDGTV
jgi:uncharacterized protein